MRYTKRLSFVIAALSLLVEMRADAQQITRVEFSGNFHIPSTRLLESVRALDNNPISRNYTSKGELLLGIQHLDQPIKDLYRKDGFLFAAIDSFHVNLAVPTDSAQGYRVQMWIHEGLLYKLRSIAFTGNSLLSSEELRSKMSSSIGDALDDGVLQADIQNMLAAYERLGYPLARISVVSIDPHTDTSGKQGLLDLHLAVDEGRRVSIGKIVIAGNSSTNVNVITRELRLVVGSAYDASAIDQARARVERLGYFESVSEPELYLLTDSTVALIVTVKEANTSAIDGVLGYNPGRSTSDAGYISGIANLSFKNIGGTGRNAALVYDRETQASQVLEVHYLEPWLFGYPLNIAGGFLQRQQDSTYTRTTTTGDLALTVSDQLSLIGSLAYERVIPTDQANQPFSVYDSKTLTTGLSVTTDTRDNSIAPHSGVLGNLGASYGVKSIYGPGRFIDSSTPSSIALRTLFLDAIGYQTLFSPRVVGVIGIHARSVIAFGGDLDPSDLFRLGGIYSIRGYREAELLASRYAYGNLEFRAMTGQLSFLFVFLDGGYIMRDMTKRDSSEHLLYPLSYGFGAQVESPLGILSVSIGLAKGEPIDQAKFHFGLIKQF